MHASIRPAVRSDVARLAELLSQLGYPSAPEAVGRRLLVLLARPDYRVVVAEADETVLGFAALHVFPAIHADRALALIAALVVDEGFRGGGVGRRLVDDLERHARAQGCERILVTTANHRTGAHSFYEQLGFEFTGRRYAKALV